MSSTEPASAKKAGLAATAHQLVSILWSSDDGLKLVGILAGAFFAVVSALTVAAFVVGKYVGDSAASSYKAANEIGLGNLAEQAQKAAIELRHAAIEFSELTNAKKRLDELQKKFNVAQAKLSAAQAQSAAKIRDITIAKEAEINKISSDLRTVTSALVKANTELQAARAELAPFISPESNRRVDRDGAATFYRNRVTIGYSDTGANSIRIYVNNKPYPPIPGVTIQAENSGVTSCLVTPTKVDTFYIVVNVRCQQ